METISYGSDPLQTLDLYRGARPGVVVVLHGGGWSYGDKAEFGTGAAFYRDRFVSLGYTVASVNYRLTHLGDPDVQPPNGRYRALLEDVESAATVVCGECREPIVILGESAGGHLAALAGVRNRAGYAGFVSLYGPMSLWEIQAESAYDWDIHLKALLGGDLKGEPWAYEARYASPRCWVEGIMPMAPPSLFVHGAIDDLVRGTQSSRMVAALQGRGRDATLIMVPDAWHGGPPFVTSPISDQIEAWVAARLPQPKVEEGPRKAIEGSALR